MALNSNRESPAPVVSVITPAYNAARYVEHTLESAVRQTFADFELSLEWRVSEGGNSGVIYRITEQGEATWHTGPEMQIIDDDRHPEEHDEPVVGRRNRREQPSLDLSGD